MGRYRLLRKLGQGGMGAVYEAVHTKLQNRVALKLLPRELAENPQAVARFEREMRAVGRVEHPGIVAARDADEADGSLYLAMELVDGEDLSDVLRGIEFGTADGPADRIEETDRAGSDSETQLSIDRPRMAIGAACEAIRQASLAMQAAHDAGLIHRDLKPANLMLTRDGVVKVLDLGLARIEDEMTGASTEITSPDQVMGTVDYMAPEQAAAGAIVDGRADVYALAATLYRLLSGQSVFDSSRYDTLLRKLGALANDTPVPLPALRADCPPELAATIEAAMAKNADERTATAGELAAALEPFASGEALRELAATLPEPSPAPDPGETTMPLEVTLDESGLGADITAETQTFVGSGAGDVSLAETMSAGGFAIEATADRPKRVDDATARGGARWIALGVLLLATLIAALLLRLGPEAKPIADADQTDQAGSGETRPSATGDASPLRRGIRFVDRRGGVDAGWDVSLDEPLTIEATVIAASSFEEQPNRSGVIVSLGDAFQMHQYGPHWARHLSDEAFPGKKNFIPEQPVVVPGQRTRLAVVFDRTDMRMYVDGRRVMRAEIETVPGQRHDVHLGSAHLPDEGNFGAFDGIIEEVRFSRAARYDADHEPARQLTADDDTLALYTFASEAGSRIADASGNDRHGTLIGGDRVTVPTKPVAAADVRYGLRLTADADQVNAGWELPIAEPLTIEATVIPDFDFEEQPQRSGDIVSIGGAVILGQYGPKWSGYLYDRYFEIGEREYDDTKRHAIRPGQRTRLALVKSPSHRRLFVDGRLVFSEPVRSLEEDAKTVFIGRQKTTPAPGENYHPFAGIIEEVRISGAARYDGDYEPPARLATDDQTLALYQFDDAAGHVVTDSSGNDRHGRLTSGMWTVAADQWPLLTRGGLSLYDFDPTGENRTFGSLQKAGQRVSAEMAVEERPFITLPVRRKFTEEITFEAIVVPMLADQTDENLSRQIVSLNGRTSLKTYNDFWDFMFLPEVFTGTPLVQTRPPVVAGRRVFLSGTRDGQMMFLHVDGVLAKQVSLRPKAALESEELIQPIELGIHSYPFRFQTTPLPGVIEQLRVSSVARYVADDYVPPATLAGSADEHTLVLYDFTTDRGDQLIDRSGNGHHAARGVGRWIRPATD